MTLGTMLIFLKCMPNPFTSHVSRCHLWTFGAWSYPIPLLPPLAEKKKKLPCTCGYGSARASRQHDTSKRTSESDFNAMLAQMWYTNVILHAFKKTVHKKTCTVSMSIQALCRYKNRPTSKVSLGNMPCFCLQIIPSPWHGRPMAGGPAPWWLV